MTLLEEVKAFLKDVELADVNHGLLRECIERAGWLMLSAVAYGAMGLARDLGAAREQLRAKARIAEFGAPVPGAAG